MIEVIYKEESQETQDSEGTFGLPRNIRQIGLIGDDCRIYMEDYVYTFLVRLARSEKKPEEQAAKTAVLTGETKYRGGTLYLFIKGAIIAEDMEAAQDHIDFSVEVWEKIHQAQKQYFEDQEIVGWFFSGPQLALEVTELLTRVHLKHFGGEKVLMLMEPQEHEDAFFRYENNVMVRLEGYYLYYEKNPCMQNYMLEKNKELQPEITEQYEDKAVKDFRKIITDKKEEKKENTAPSVFSYGLTACLAIAVLTVGVNFYRNYQGLDEIQNTEAQTASVIVEEITAVPTETPVPAKTAAVQKKKAVQTVSAGKKKKTQDTKQTAAASDKTEQAPDTKKQTDKSEQIYKEEADERKAQKRVRDAAHKENEAAASDAVQESYVIQPGDTLFQICMDRYGSSEEIREICELNDITVDEIIYPGQVIVLP